jgi:hypothetical protein
MALAEGQVQVRDLVMGRGTSYKMLQFNPWTRGVRSDQGGARAWNHGSWSGVEWATEAAVPMRIQVLGTDAASWFQLHSQLAAAFRPVGESTVDVELRWMLGGAEYVMFGRPRMVEPEASMLGTGLVYTKAAFVALDPMIYTGAETVTAAIGLPTFTGGLTVPFTVPFTVDGVAVDGFADIANTGTADTGLSLRIDGPVSAPSVTLQRADGSFQRLVFDLELSAGQWLDVDTANRVVLLNGTTSRRGQTSGHWPILPQGEHTLRWSSPKYNDVAKLSVRFRSAWH